MLRGARALLFPSLAEGFGIPLASWLRGELSPLIHEYLSPQRVREQGIFDPALVARAARAIKALA